MISAQTPSMANSKQHKITNTTMSTNYITGHPLIAANEQINAYSGATFTEVAGFTLAIYMSMVL